MKVLTIGSDRNLFKTGSEVQRRIKEYGQLFDELRIIVFASRKLQITNYKLQISDNVFVYSTNYKSQFFYLWDVYKIIKSWGGWKPDVITCQDPMAAGLAGWLLKIYFGAPLQIQVHADIFSSYFWQESFKNKVGVLLAKFLLPRADGIRVVSQRIKDSLESNVPSMARLVAGGKRPVLTGRQEMSNVSMLPIFVDVKKIQTAKAKTNLREKYPDYDFIILMASRLTREKNIGMAIEAFNGIRYQVPGIRNPLLLIVGDGPEREVLKSQITNYKLQKNVIIESWTDDLVSYYKTADLFLLTSNHESYARTVVEAMAAGLPVIMTDVGLAGEFLVDDLDGRVVPVGDVKALTRAVSELMENPAKREEFRKNSLKLLEKWPAKMEYLKAYSDNILKLFRKK